MKCEDPGGDAEEAPCDIEDEFHKGQVAYGPIADPVPAYRIFSTKEAVPMMFEDQVKLRKATPLKIGRRYSHPDHGTIEITGGHWIHQGILRNRWTCRPVRDDGSLGEELSVHGGYWPEIQND